jgi:hypothetical protein
VKGRRKLAARRRKPYLHVIVLPEGGVILELEPHGGGGDARAAELVVEAVRRHRGCSGEEEDFRGWVGRKQRAWRIAVDGGGGGGGGGQLRLGFEMGEKSRRGEETLSNFEFGSRSHSSGSVTALKSKARVQDELLPPALTAWSA